MQPINSDFGGASRTFEIKPESVALFEASMGRSLYAVLQTFTNGTWTFNDVAAVLSFALHGPTVEQRRAWDQARHAQKFGFPWSMPGYVPHPSVVATLQAEGHGNFAELAAEILTAAIFGEVQEVAGDD